ncbi:LacI family DNA-binding transcriptional regulator [Castellaniella sp.]|uniref:LacI family DNA-binding transcriptional regulator n=1 Tax=Castellaniella sp. TaxID=1955812 RepID=UPI002AFFDF63|nr:LacI family DNA-binding transcriptional regulator [Castellaniella sp.]
MKRVPTARYISAHEVAQRAGVSRSAVSRAFTEGASVAPGTRQKILKAAEELGYQVNDLARGLLAHRSKLVGMIASDAETPFRSLQIAALSRLLVSSGRVPVLIPTEAVAQASRASHTTLLRYRAEATVILSGMPSRAFVEAAQLNGQPIITVGRTEQGPDHIHIDNTLAARTVARLFHARGMRRIGLVTSNVGSPNLMEREHAYIQHAAELGMTVKVGRADHTDYEGGLSAASLLLSAQPMVEGVFCVNDLMAFGLMDFARTTLGLSIPSELSVIGFDDVAQAQWGAYQLTTFRQDAGRQAAEIMQVLERRLKNPDEPPITISLELPLVVRNSLRTL